MFTPFVSTRGFFLQLSQKYFEKCLFISIVCFIFALQLKTTTMTNEMQTLSLTQEDINLITLALRRLAKQTDFLDIRDSAYDLIDYIETESKNNQS